MSKLKKSRRKCGGALGEGEWKEEGENGREGEKAAEIKKSNFLGQEKMKKIMIKVRSSRS